MDENQVADSGGIGLLANLILKIIPATSANFTVATLASTSDSFYLAEHIFHVSEIIAVLIATLAAKDALLGLKTNKVEAYQSWEFLAFVTSLLMFYLMLLIFTLNMFANKWLKMLMGIMAAFVTPLIASYVFIGFGQFVLINQYNGTMHLLWFGVVFAGCLSRSSCRGVVFA